MPLQVNKWDLRFMQLAQLVAGWSKDPSTKVGAVIVDGRNHIAGIGYNGFPPGVDDAPERYAQRETKYALIVHAEANAILNSHGQLFGMTLYTLKYPCSSCAKLIVMVGILRVVCPQQDSANASDQRWAQDREHAQLILREGGVEVDEVDYLDSTLRGHDAYSIQQLEEAQELAAKAIEGMTQQLLQLRSTLKWALDTGAHLRHRAHSLMDGGCGCCGDVVDPPEGSHDLVQGILAELRAEREKAEVSAPDGRSGA